jgi:DNA-binding transcriptional MerR regulator
VINAGLLLVEEMMNSDLTLEQLSNEVEKQLKQRGLLDAQHDGRVSAAPDGRTIRYYTTLGILEKPKVISRQAFYGKRHVLQILAIKSLQGLSLPLGEIQARLYGKSDKELEAILDSISNKLKSEQRTRAEFHPMIWREVMIEPGLKIMIEDQWRLSDEESLNKRIQSALSALVKEEKK